MEEKKCKCAEKCTCGSECECTEDVKCTEDCFFIQNKEKCKIQHFPSPHSPSVTKFHISSNSLLPKVEEESKVYWP